jgi:hypothetical protein
MWLVGKSEFVGELHRYRTKQLNATRKNASGRVRTRTARKSFALAA